MGFAAYHWVLLSLLLLDLLRFNPSLFLVLMNVTRFFSVFLFTFTDILWDFLFVISFFLSLRTKWIEHYLVESKISWSMDFFFRFFIPFKSFWFPSPSFLWAINQRSGNAIAGDLRRTGPVQWLVVGMAGVVSMVFFSAIFIGRRKRIFMVSVVEGNSLVRRHGNANPGRDYVRPSDLRRNRRRPNCAGIPLNFMLPSFYRVLPVFYRVLPGFTGFYWV